MTNSKTALFLRETRCFDDEISHQTREPRAREVFMRANATPHFRSRRRISKLASKYSSHHPRKNNLFCRLGFKNETIGIVLKARDWCSKSPSRIPTRTERNENNDAFAYLGGDFRGSNGRSSQRKHFVFVQVCVCVDTILNEVIFDLAAAFVKRAKTREKRGVHIASKKYTEENLGWRGWIDYCSSLSRSSSSPFTDL